MLTEAVSLAELWTAQWHGGSIGYLQFHDELGRNMSAKRRMGYPARRAIFAALAAVGAGSCVRQPTSPVAPEVAELAGCYALTVGPWLAPDGTLLTAARFDAPSFVPPSRVQLVPSESNVPILGHYQLEPQPGAADVFRSATWRVAADSLILEWSSGGRLGDSVLFVRLRRVGATYRGRVTAETDVVRPRPYREAEAIPIDCQ
jgi:hypothetical protein